MKLLLLLLVLSLPITAEDIKSKPAPEPPARISDADARTLREAQLVIVRAESLQVRAALAAEEARKAQEKIGAIVARLQKEHKCEGCELDDATLEWRKPKPKKETTK